MVDWACKIPSINQSINLLDISLAIVGVRSSPFLINLFFLSIRMIPLTFTVRRYHYTDCTSCAVFDPHFYIAKNKTARGDVRPRADRQFSIISFKA